MLRALMDAGVEPDLLVGASVGAINAAAFAAEPTTAGVDRLARTWKSLRADTVFPHHHYEGWRFIQRRDSVYPADPLAAVIRGFLTYERLEEARVPLHVMSSSLTTGEERWLTSGSAVTALLASAAIPGVFPPVALDGESLIDGGVLNDVPLSRAWQRGAELVIALLCGPVRPPPPVADRPVDALLAAFSVAVHGRFLRDVDQVPDGHRLVVMGADVPELAGYWDFSRTVELIEAGHAAAEEVLAASI